MFRTLFFLSVALCQGAFAQAAFREDFKEVPAHIPVVAADLTSPFLSLERFGPDADQLKLSYHPEIPDDPHYIWNGECSSPTFLSFPFKKALDLSDKNWVCQLNTKNFGKSTLHLALRSHGQWFVQKKPVANQKDWNDQVLSLHQAEWLSVNPESVQFGKEAKPDFLQIDAIGFAAPVIPNRSKDCIRLNWFELLPQAPPAPEAAEGVEAEKKKN